MITKEGWQSDLAKFLAFFYVCRNEIMKFSKKEEKIIGNDHQVSQLNSFYIKKSVIKKMKPQTANVSSQASPKLSFELMSASALIA